MNFKQDIKNTTKEYLNKLGEVNKKINDLRSNKTMYSDNYYKNAMQELEIERDNITLEANKVLADKRAAFKNSISGRYAMSGEELTSDTELLKFLSGEDMNALYDKYKGNNTMQRIISDYGIKNAVDGFTRHFRAIEDDLQAVEDMERYARDIFARPDFEEDLNKMYFGEEA